VNQQPEPFELRTGGGKKYVDEKALLTEWPRGEPLYLIIEQDRLPHWQHAITDRVHIFHQVATCGTYVILTNQL
jgi:hypothetical protein